MNDFEPTVPRWIQIPVGLLMLPFMLLCLAGSAMFAVSPPAKHRALAIAIGLLMVLVCFWCIGKAVCLIFGWHTRGGLMGPMALRIVGVFFLLLPLAGFFTGYYSRWGLLGILQALAYVSIFFGLFSLARSRSHPEAQHGAQPDRLNRSRG